MSLVDRFSRVTVQTLAKRAANQCSNPSCGATTSGPTESAHGSVNVGEAAHIYGANPGSARYKAEMMPVERSSISNAIWLCGNCHKLVDDDASRYPAGLLFEWQREHERVIKERVGKASAQLRERYEKRHLHKFGELSYAAERLIIEKGDLWEYALTAQVLRDETFPLLRRAQALHQGLYVKPSVRIPKEASFSWISDRSHEISLLAKALGSLGSSVLARAWGEPGVAGNDELIVETARLFGELCRSAIAVEESIRFARLDECFGRVHSLFFGVTLRLIEQIEKIPVFLFETIESKPTSGSYKIVLTITLPEGWSEEVDLALKSAQIAYFER